MQGKKNIQAFLALLLIPLLMGLSINAVRNSHSHLLNNGRIITHAHPFLPDAQNKPYQSHPHSPATLFLIQSLYTYLLVVVHAFSLFLFLFLLSQVPVPEVCHLLLPHRNQLSQRAPPLL